MTNEQIEKERAAFEEWYARKFGHKKRFNYGSRETWLMFTCWTGAKEHAEQSALNNHDGLFNLNDLEPLPESTPEQSDMTEEEIEQEQAAFEDWYNRNLVEKKKFDYRLRETWLMFTSWLAGKYRAEQSVSNWIPVTEKYPEEPRQEVIVKLADGVVKIAFYSRFIPYGQTQPLHYFEGALEHIDGGEYNALHFENVEYWKPLPE